MSSWDQANRRQKLGFGLEKQNENQPNYQRLLSLTVLPLNYFMSSAFYFTLHNLLSNSSEQRNTGARSFQVGKKLSKVQNSTLDRNKIRDIMSRRNFLRRSLSDNNANIHGYDVTANSSCGWNKRRGERTEVPPPMNIPVPDGGAAAEGGLGVGQG